MGQEGRVNRQLDVWVEVGQIVPRLGWLCCMASPPANFCCCCKLEGSGPSSFPQTEWFKTENDKYQCVGSRPVSKIDAHKLDFAKIAGRIRRTFEYRKGF